MTSTYSSRKSVVWALLCVAGLTLPAAECVWSGSSGNWSDVECWENAVKPSSAGDTVKIASANASVVVTDSDIDNFELVTKIAIDCADSRIVIDTTQDVTSPAEFSGNGKLVKKGTSLLKLTYPGEASLNYAAIGRIGELIISNGVVRIPDRSSANGFSSSITLPKISVWKPGVLLLGDSASAICNYGIWGDGSISNEHSECQLKLFCRDLTDGIPVFSGRIEPKVQLTISSDNVYGTGIQYMTGEGSDRSITLRLHGIVGITKFGNAGEPSPLGSEKSIQLRERTSKIVYLGETGEETDKNIAFSSSCPIGTLDAGAYGGVTFKGEWWISAYSGWGEVSDYQCNTIRLTGSNTLPCIVKAPMYDMKERAATYWIKEGTGTWRFTGTKQAKGTFDVRRGTLQFESIYEKGVASSLGDSSMTFDDVSHLSDRTIEYVRENHPVPYAFRLGDEKIDEYADAVATLEYIGEADASCSTRPIAVTGAGRVLSTGGALKLAGATALGNGKGTLVLDGAGLNEFSSVTNGLGSLNIVKRGAGSWHLSDDIDIDSAVAEEGTLQIGSRYTYYRWTIRANNGGAGDEWIASFSGFALMDAEGNIVNGTLGSKGMASGKNGKASTLLPGEICYNKWYSSTLDRYPSKSFWYLPDEGKFAGGSAAIDVTVKLNDPSTHPVLYFRPDEGVDVYRYDILSDTNKKREVAYWELAGSVDGVNWTTLHKIDETTGTPAPFDKSVWYSTGTNERRGYEIDPWNKDSRILIGAVGVKSGGVMEFIGSSKGKIVPTLIIDAQNPGGTIKGASFASDGTLEIRSWSDDMIGVELPIDLSGCTGVENISAYSLVLNGESAGKCVSVGKRGVTVRDRGLAVTVR